MEISVTTTLGLAAIIFILFKLITRPKSKKNMLPGPWRLPIIGHMHHLIGTMPHHSLMDLARKHGPLMHLQLGEVSTVVVSSPRWAKEVSTTFDITFANKPETLTGEIVGYRNTGLVLAPYGEYWRQLRKLFTLELLSNTKVKSFQSLREEECWNLVKNIRSSSQGYPINLSENIFKMIPTMLSRAAFGKGIKDQMKFTELVKEVLRVEGGFDVADLFPSKMLIHHLSRKRSKLTNIHNKLDILINNIIAEHIGNHTTSSQETLLDVLLRLKESVDFSMSADNVKAAIFDMFAAGTDTSSATVEWVISELIRCPRAMEKVQAELRQALNGKERFQEEDIQELNYLKLVIKETLRLHPPLPLVMRLRRKECREPCVLGGYNIPTNTTLIVNIHAINRDPRYWKDAETFIPERFENNPITLMGSEYEYLSFGAGRRMCPGASLGLANVELLLAHILYYFNWKLPNGKGFEDLDMTESLGVTVKRKTALLLVPTNLKTLQEST